MAVAPDPFSDQISSRRPEIPGFARRNFALAILGTIVLLLLIARAWRLNRGSAYSAPDFAGATAHTIPPQQAWSPAPDPPPPPALIEMGDRQAAKYIVRDISSAAEGQWRWTFVDPTLQIFLKNYQGQRFLMDFGIVDTTFRDTGPVTLSCYINGRLLGQIRCLQPGDYHFEKPVPAAWLSLQQPTIVRMVLDKVWTAPSDGARLGYVLTRAGFKD